MTETTLLSVHPRYLISRIADSATVLNDIQDTTAGDSFSISTGYPEAYARPFDKNGKPLNRSELNNVFNLLSQLHFYWQMGGVPVWDSRIAAGEGSYSTIGGYPRNARVFKMIGNKMEEFLSLEDDNHVEPTLSSTAHWERVTMGGDAVTKDYVDNAIQTLSGNAQSSDSTLKGLIDSQRERLMTTITTLSGNANTTDSVLSGQILELSGAISGFSKGLKVLDVMSNKSSVAEILEETGHGGETFNQGDVLIVTAYDTVEGAKVGTTKTSYVYGETDWCACCGHSIDASKVFISAAIDLAGNYTRVGNLTKDSTSKTVKNKFPKNTSIQKIISDLLDTSVVPKQSSAPKNEIELRNGSSTAALATEMEVGEKFTPWYKVKYTDGQFECAGKYTNAGCPNNSRSVVDSEGHTAGAQEGTIFQEFTVGDGTDGQGVNNYKLSAATTYGDSTVVPKDNKDVSHPEVKILGNTTASADSGTVVGIRLMFWGMDAGTDDLTSSNASQIVRALKHFQKTPSSETMISSKLPASEFTNAKRCIIAIPASTSKKPVLVRMPSSAYVDITTSFIQKGPFSVEGKNGYPGVSYNVWVFQPSSLDSTATYEITIG